MERTLKLVGKTSNEIFMLRYPRSVLNFCDYDLAYFAENAVAVCDRALRDGEPDFERMTDLRNSLKGAHVYIEHHLRTTYDRIVTDCWIDYVCRRDNVGTGALWNRFIGCHTAFEKMVFQRLCDYRYNRAINEWLNLVRIQDYTKTKLNFIFSRQLSGAEEAAARRNYFDLMFSVAAKEMGCHLEDLGVTKIFSVGRLPSAPFLLPNVSKDIVKNLLADFDYSEDYSDTVIDDTISDQVAMDAFAHIKGGLAQEFDSYNVTRCSMENISSDVYMPCSFKAAVDLEIDALIESGGWLSRCKRCGRYFLRDGDHREEYCSLPNTGTKTCLEIYEEQHPRSLVTPEMEKQCRTITDDMYSRVDKTMSLEEYESWKTYLDALVKKVENGEIPSDELMQFIEYSKSMDLSRSKPMTAVPKRERETPHERVVKPFVPQRISRSELDLPPRTEPDEEETSAKREAFFTSPSVQRQKSERASISHIIRAGEPRGEYIQQSSGFVPFGMSSPAPAEKQVPVTPVQPVAPQKMQPAADAFVFRPFGAEPTEEKQQPAVPVNTAAVIEPTDDLRQMSRIETPPPEHIPEKAAVEPVREKMQTNPEPAAPQTQPRVIRKNAAAISAYGKIAGTPMSTAPVAMEQISRPEPQETSPQSVRTDEPDREPFKDIGSIFDVLEQSENDLSGKTSEKSREPHSSKSGRSEKKHSEKTTSEERKIPERVSVDNAPSGIWTEERHLFDNAEPTEPQEQESELSALRDKKHGRSSKTQRLFDVIMREPEDNPSVRKKKE